MNFGEQLVRIRRMLRDPDGNIWSRSFLKTSYNNTQREIQRRTRFLENATVLKYPPLYQASYLFEWEWLYLPSGTRFFKALRDHQQGDYSYCARFEAQTAWGTDDVVTETGVMFTHPWEAFMGESVGLTVAIKFPENFHTAKFLAWDKWPIEYKTKKSITQSDSSYVTREGRPLFYYREDDADNSFIPYPKPSTVSWDDEVPPADPIYVYSQSWESDYVTGEQFTRDDDDNSRTYVHIWEIDLGTSLQSYARGMWLFEVGIEAGTSINYLEDDDTELLGTIIRRDGSLLSQEGGLTVDILDATDDFFLIYDCEPTEITEDSDVSDFPTFLQKYIEYGVLRDAYGSLTDGKIGSLKDYWGSRFEMGVEAIKRYQLARRQDRDYRLVTKQLPLRRSNRHPSLPSTYPAV